MDVKSMENRIIKRSVKNFKRILAKFNSFQKYFGADWMNYQKKIEYSGQFKMDKKNYRPKNSNNNFYNGKHPDVMKWISTLLFIVNASQNFLLMKTTSS